MLVSKSDDFSDFVDKSKEKMEKNQNFWHRLKEHGTQLCYGDRNVHTYWTRGLQSHPPCLFSSNRSPNFHGKYLFYETSFIRFVLDLSTYRESYPFHPPRLNGQIPISNKYAIMNPNSIFKMKYSWILQYLQYQMTVCYSKG